MNNQALIERTERQLAQARDPLTRAHVQDYLNQLRGGRSLGHSPAPRVRLPAGRGRGA